jgi:hypothetical protein
LVYSIFNKKEFFTQNKCAFCIPLHPKHFDYGYEIAKSLRNTDVDLYFIFTDDDDKDLFYETTNESNYLILSDFVDIKRLNKKKNMGKC